MSLDKVGRFRKGEQDRGVASVVMNTRMVMARVATEKGTALEGMGGSSWTQGPETLGDKSISPARLGKPGSRERHWPGPGV